MTESSNAQLARRWFEEVWNQRRDATVRELMDPKVVGHMEGLEVHSPEDFLQARAALLDGLPDLAVTVEDVISDEENVVVRWSARGTHSGHGLGILPSSRVATFRGMSWIVFSGGRIVKGWDSWNQGALLSQLAAPAGAARESGAS